MGRAPALGATSQALQHPIIEPAPRLIRAASVWAAVNVGTKEFKPWYMVNTKNARIQAPKILRRAAQEAQKISEGTSWQASERASKQAGGWAHEPRAGERASKRSSVRWGREQAALNVIPIVHCKGRRFAVVCKQTGERGAFIQLYTFEGRYLNEYKVPLYTS